MQESLLKSYPSHVAGGDKSDGRGVTIKIKPFLFLTVNVDSPPPPASTNANMGNKHTTYLIFLEFIPRLLECHVLCLWIFALLLKVLQPVVQDQVIVMELLP